jgi:hypothetical protein
MAVGLRFGAINCRPGTGNVKSRIKSLRNWRFFQTIDAGGGAIHIRVWPFGAPP